MSYKLTEIYKYRYWQLNLLLQEKEITELMDKFTNLKKHECETEKKTWDNDKK